MIPAPHYPSIYKFMHGEFHNYLKSFLMIILSVIFKKLKGITWWIAKQKIVGTTKNITQYSLQGLVHVQKRYE